MAAGTKKAARAVRRKLPLRSAKKKSMLETEKAKATIPKSRVRIKPKIADLPTERQKVVRMQNRIATANKRAKGGQELKLVENKRVRENYIMKIVIVSTVEICCNDVTGRARLLHSAPCPLTQCLRALTCLLGGIVHYSR